jgi:hypothetical protein
VSILGRFVEGVMLGQHELRHQPPKLIIIVDFQGRLLLHNQISRGHKLIRQEVHHACRSRTTRSFRLILWAPDLFLLDPRLPQFAVPQVLKPPFLTLS